HTDPNTDTSHDTLPHLVSPPVPFIPPLFFHHPRNPRPLHSFPTRRSSDLSRSVRSSIATTDGSKRTTPSPRRKTTVFAVPRASRSEEHTSELQSLRHLVCRLLLEKKKKEDENTSQNSETQVVRSTYERALD